MRTCKRRNYSLTVSINAQQANLGWITSSFLWHILQDQYGVIEDFVRLNDQRKDVFQTLHCRAAMCSSVNVWHGPDGGWYTYTYTCTSSSVSHDNTDVVIDQACV